MRLKKNNNWSQAKLYGDGSVEAKKARGKMHQVPNNRRTNDGTLKQNNRKPEPRAIQNEMFARPRDSVDIRDGPDFRKIDDEKLHGKKPYQGDMFRDEISSDVDKILNT